MTTDANFDAFLYLELGLVVALGGIGIIVLAVRLDSLKERVKALETTLDHLGLYDDGGLR